MLCRVRLERNVSLCLLTGGWPRYHVSPVLRHRVLACCQPGLACIHAMAAVCIKCRPPCWWPPQRCNGASKMHIRHTADRFRLIACIEKEPTASSSCRLMHVQQEALCC